MKNTLVGGILVLLVVGTLWFVKLRDAKPTTIEAPAQISPPGATAVLQLNGYVGGEKMGLMQNPKILRILREKYGLSIKVERKGSVEMVTTEPLAGPDFIWPASQNQVETYKLGGRPSKGDEIVLVSPIVLFSWDIVQAGLSAKGLVATKDGVYYLPTDQLVKLVTIKTKWSEVGLGEIFGTVHVAFTDPLRSNSGAQYLALLATILTGEEALTPANVETVRPAIAHLQETQGLTQGSSGELFSQYVKQGPGAFPLVAGYENQIIEFGQANPDMAELIRTRLRILYPTPTIWSNHPIIALTDNGKKLIVAMRDAEIRRLAWSEHGFRTEISTIDPKDLSFLPGIPHSITSTVRNPSTTVLDALFSHPEPATKP